MKEKCSICKNTGYNFNAYCDCKKGKKLKEKDQKNNIETFPLQGVLYGHTFNMIGVKINEEEMNVKCQANSKELKS